MGLDEGDDQMAKTPQHELPQTDQDWRERLTPQQYEVTRRAGTERAFTGDYWDCHDDGTYVCVCCGAPLFSSDTKFESGTGWPSFFQALDAESVEERVDQSHGMTRTEAVCSNCGAHLGHVFPDGPRPTGLRYCMNSASLKLEKPDPRADAERDQASSAS
jgi:peptide-methionine (R)-S-oxide reductase